MAAKKIAEEGKVLKGENFQAMKEANPFQMRPSFTTQRIVEVRISMLQYQGFIYFLLQVPNSGVLLFDEKIKPYRAGNMLYAYLDIISSCATVVKHSFLLNYSKALTKILPPRRRPATPADTVEKRREKSRKA